MPLINPNTSKAPAWRLQPKQIDHPITAWRCWDVELVDGEWKLMSLAAPVSWDGPVIRADFKPFDVSEWDKEKRSGVSFYESKAARTFILSGVYAVKDRELALDVLDAYNASVLGEVHLWGRVAQFTRGYRAEMCMVKKLWIAEEHWNQKIANALAQTYGCDVELLCV